MLKHQKECTDSEYHNSSKEKKKIRWRLQRNFIEIEGLGVGSEEKNKISVDKRDIG